MDIHDYLRVFRRNVVLIISATLIGVSVGALVALNTAPRYEASTELLVAAQSPSGSSVELNLGRTYAQQAITSYVALVSSSLVLQPVIDDLGLDVEPSALAGKVRASAAINSLAITVTVSDRNPSQAARLANAIGDSFATVVVEQLEKRPDDASSLIRIDTLQAAQVPVTPVAPNMVLSILIGGLIGLAAGIGGSALRTILDTRIRSTKDVERATAAPLLGAIAFDSNASSQPLIMAANRSDPRAEAFRSLRTNVQFLAIGGESAVFVVTSAGPGEGKSTTAANLAIAFAESGARVALVDGDLRLPRVADYFGIEGGVGLSDVLAGRIPASEAMQRWGRGTLFLLPAGTVPPNPAELLGSGGMKSLLAELKRAFDVIIIDAPPVLLVTDATVIASRANGALLVAASGKTTIPRLSAAVESIEKIGANVLGTIVTMLPTTGVDKASYGEYSYGATHQQAPR
ncbi:polysaccharide biosynthesis tyrosine autokinase [Microbacterium sp. MYb66]|jgi:capsular exopolysaccharide synthesis family protein|uniref:polysaccharide biosynthesis tyrosine autokinase n=1 Tax=Microbacterium sp. MYb66 TaxID=1848692 RepID=UPI000D00D617|nr:polysaccharide biosynthesis tyrosine autokinase [Microbacterium sp. MYb66]PRA81993.1 chromosome partitioning protein [Microbacterium sp. MYb66]